MIISAIIVNQQGITVSSASQALTRLLPNPPSTAGHNPSLTAMKNDIYIKRSLEIPDRETVYAVIALGYPRDTDERVTGRKKTVATIL